MLIEEGRDTEKKMSIVLLLFSVLLLVVCIICIETNNLGAASPAVEPAAEEVSYPLMEAKNRSDVFFIFPEVFRERKEDCKTSMVLKSPKTESSVRELFIPNSVAEALLEWKAMQEQQKQAALDAWEDYDLVITLPNGRPREERLIAKAFKAFIEEQDLPMVVFHSLRHLSTSMKLQVSGGDIKAVQGDTGHAQASMVTEVYAHTFDENRKRIADQLEVNFFSANPKEAPKTEDPDREALLRLLESDPELSSLLLAMAKKVS